MSAIFLSHASDDAEAAERLGNWLRDEHKHQGFFLDFDPRNGIPGGRNWESELYRQLAACRAMIVLCSPASMASRWCFAEVALARSMGKPVFPVKVAPCEVLDILQSVQVIDLTAGEEEARERLSRGLKTAGLHSADLFGWDIAAGRPPYPGLAPFDEADAGVFFGRDAEIGEGLEQLIQMRRQGGAGMLLVLGGSGAGKSSLVRAGLLPRLRIDEERWVVLTPSRPGYDPHATLARILAEALGEAGLASADEIHGELAPGRPLEERVEALVARVLQVQGLSNNPDPRVVLVVDQLEEALQQPPDHAVHDMIRLLRGVMERDDAPLIVIATMRSDYLGEFLNHPALKGIGYANLTVGPMTAESLRQIVELPAQLAAIELEEGLTETLLQDADTDYALPLLAFTLRELVDTFLDASTRRLRIEDYSERLRGVEGAIRKAVERRLPAAMTPEQEEALQRAFLAMVAVDAKGRVSRQTAAWSEIEAVMGGAEAAEQLLGPFVDGLLLRPGSVEGGARGVEVTHEALFTNWRRLRRWIHDHQDELKLRERLEEATEQWIAGGRSGDNLIDQRLRLEQAVTLVESDRVPLDDEVREFVDASRERVERREVRRRRRTRAIFGGTVAAALVMAVLWSQAERARSRSVAAEAEAQAQVSLFLAAETERSELDLGLLLALEAYDASPTLEARNALAAKTFERPLLLRFLHGTAADADPDAIWVERLLVAADGRSGVSRASGGEVRIWRLDTGASRPLEEAGPVTAVAGSVDGTRLATASEGGDLDVWTIDPDIGRASRLQAIVTGRPPVGALAMSPSGARLAAAFPGGGIAFWDAGAGTRESAVIAGAGVARTTLAFGADGSLLAVGDADGSVGVWRLLTEGGALLERPRELWRGAEGGGAVMRVAWDPSGSGLLAWVRESDSRVHYCAFEGGPAAVGCANGTQSFGAELEAVSDLAFSPDGRWLAASGQEAESADGDARAQRAWLWQVAGAERRTLEHGGIAVDALAFGGDGATLVTGGRDGKLREWSVWTPADTVRLGADVSGLATSAASGPPRLAVSGGESLSVRDLGDGSSVLEGQTDFASAVALAGRVIVAGGETGVVRIWSDEAPGGSLEVGAAVLSLALDPSGERLAVGRDDGIVGLWEVQSRERIASVRLGGPVAAVAFGAGGRRLLAASEDGGLGAWELADGRPEGEGRTQALDELPDALALRPDGERLAGADAGGVFLIDSVDGEPIRLEGHPAHRHFVSSLALSRDGRFVASASGPVHVWNLEAERLEFTLPEPASGGDVTDLAFAPDGAALFVARLNEVRRIPLDVTDWQARACERAGRELTAAERAEYLAPGVRQSVCTPAADEPPATR